jgi:divalent metal cation (Fe/Co/Zn/Cd) transporter
LIRAYHFGSKFLVEIEVILPAAMTVREAHDISLELQQAVERMDDVERAFVHVDYAKRDVDEHDVAAVARAKLQEIRDARSASATSIPALETEPGYQV